GFVRAQESCGDPVIRSGDAWRRFCGSRMQTAHDRGLITEWLERFPAERICEVLTYFVWNPIAGCHAVRNKASDKSWFGSSGRLGRCGGRGDHRFKKWQSKRGACSF